MGKLHHIECGCVDCTRMRNNTIEQLARLLQYQTKVNARPEMDAPPIDGGIRVDAIGEMQHSGTGEKQTIIVLVCQPEGATQPLKIGVTLEAFTQLNLQVSEALLLLEILSDDEPKTKQQNHRSN